MMKYNAELQNAGILLALDGLDSPSSGARITYAGGKPTVKDGPFPEAKEVLGGYWIIDVRSRDEAIEWAKRAPMSFPRRCCGCGGKSRRPAARSSSPSWLPIGSSAVTR
jgi:hypothetical protein